MTNKESMKAGGQRKLVDAKVHTLCQEPYYFSRLLTNEDIKRGKVVLSHKGFDVSVERDGSKVYLGLGFNEFVKQYGIKPGYFLIFGSTGVSMLSVIIHLRNRCADNYNRIVHGHTINKDLRIPAEDDGDVTHSSESEVNDEKLHLLRGCVTTTHSWMR